MKKTPGSIRNPLTDNNGGRARSHLGNRGRLFRAQN
jgi:hypothetical protein